jgi:hypothetical protein
MSLGLPEVSFIPLFISIIALVMLVRTLTVFRQSGDIISLLEEGVPLIPEPGSVRGPPTFPRTDIRHRHVPRSLTGGLRRGLSAPFNRRRSLWRGC